MGLSKSEQRSHEGEMKRLAPSLVVSLIMAYGCFVAPRLLPGLFMVMVPPLLWLAIVCRYIVRYRAVGLWLLIGAPLAFYNVAMVASWIWDCSHYATIQMCP
jgi:hypothetical protein